MLPTLDRLREYLGILQEFPDMVDIHKGALSKVKDCERMKEEGRIDVRLTQEEEETQRERERQTERVTEGGRDRQTRQSGRKTKRAREGRNER